MFDRICNPPAINYDLGSYRCSPDEDMNSERKEETCPFPNPVCYPGGACGCQKDVYSSFAEQGDGTTQGTCDYLDTCDADGKCKSK